MKRIYIALTLILVAVSVFAVAAQRPNNSERRAQKAAAKAATARMVDSLIESRCFTIRIATGHVDGKALKGSGFRPYEGLVISIEKDSLKWKSITPSYYYPISKYKIVSFNKKKTDIEIQVDIAAHKERFHSGTPTYYLTAYKSGLVSLFVQAPSGSTSTVHYTGYIGPIEPTYDFYD